MTNKTTNIAGFIALIGLAYHIYLEGGISVSDFLLLGAGIGLFAYKGKKDNVQSKTVDPDKDFPSEKD